MASITKPLAGLSLNHTHRLSQNLVGWWVLNDGAGAVARDYSISRNDGTLTNMNLATAWSGSPLGGSIDFDGINDFVNIPDVPVLNFGAGVLFSLSFRFKARNLSVDRTIVSKRESIGYQFRFTLGGGWFLRISDPGSTNTSVNANLSDGLWHHVVMGRDANRHFIYVDGLLDNTTPSVTLGSVQDASPLVFGSNEGASGFFDGQIDDIGIWSRALDIIDVQQLFFTPFVHILQPSISRSFVPASNVRRPMNTYRRRRAV